MNEFLINNPVFSTEQVKQLLAQRGTVGRRSADSWLGYYQKKGSIIRIKRGLYASVPIGAEPSTFTPDPFLIASRMADDAVLAYHTALEFHGRAYSLHRRLTYQTASPTRLLTFHGWQFQPVKFPKPLQQHGKENFGVIGENRDGISIRVTSLERTLVDVLNRPDCSGSWEEIWRSLESIEYFDLKQVIDYALLLDNATTIAKLGFFLEQHSRELLIEKEQLEILKPMLPKQPHYLSRQKRENGILVKEWNLIVPKEILHRTWTDII
ncbi:hypothetical protein SMSP2_02077 [Limihaloglobus sulfuriphilus]|uniref:Transcriptional regulator n=1 Tax=Limihaloglobus sulfuriphilus TaxID=1851148 RepID=A0A1Q2MG97_9BACT|nr:transcriptional regulator [Limihaloglobus sulfuriphilus]AQQ71700.1 hypothetical protein SMSP2_02077 [Limihaloglobus sulfuriphilus]